MDTEKIILAFNAAIDFAILDDEPQAFLSSWRDGDWEGIKDEWPEFDISTVEALV